MSTLLFHAQFVASKIGKTGLTPTIDIKSVNRSTGAIASVVTGGSMTENWRGVYHYRLTSADLTTYDYVAVAITSDATVDQKEIPALWTQFGESANVDLWKGATAPAMTGDAYARIGANGSGLTAIWNGIDISGAGAFGCAQLYMQSMASTIASTSTTVSTISTNVLTSLFRIGGFTGTGVNTVLGFFQALMRSDGTLPTDLGGTYDPVDDSLQALSAGITTVTDPLTNPTPGSYAVGTAGWRLGLITSGSNVTVVSPVAQSGSVLIWQGDDYLSVDNRAIIWTESTGDWPTLTSATIAVKLTEVITGTVTTYTGAVVVATGSTKSVKLQLTRVQTAAMNLGAYTYRVIATLSNTDVVSLAQGNLLVRG